MAKRRRSRIDVHLHLSQYWPDLRTNSYRPDLDFSTRSLLRELDAQGIERGILLQINDSPSVEETLREASKFFEESQGRLLQTSTVDPTRGVEEVRRAIALWEKVPSLVALKLYPGYQHFYPHDRRLDELYEFAHRRGIPVMIHQGDTMNPLGFLKFARPVEVDEVTVRYRDVRFVLCHLGNPWIDEAAEVVFKNENAYADSSGLLANPKVPYFSRMVERSRRRIAAFIEYVGSSDRLLYGSDWPLLSIKTAVSLIDGLKLPVEDRERILGGNARQLYRLEKFSS